jgi:hypothetical protein
MGGEPAALLLREEKHAVHEHVELALCALLDLGLMLRPGVQLGRETRGPRVVAVSDGAVLDQDASHDANLPVDSAPPEADDRCRLASSERRRNDERSYD